MKKKLKVLSLQAVAALSQAVLPSLKKVLGLALIGSFAVSAPVCAAEPGDRIKSMDVVLSLGKNSSLFVSETMLVDFAANQHHGIVRRIPLRSIVNGREMHCRIEPTQVDCDQAAANYVVDRSANELSIKIGDADKLLSGEHRYKIQYFVTGAVRLAGDKPELYWNAVGDGWKMPIQKVRAVFVPPKDVKVLNTTAFAGVAGSHTQQSSAHTALGYEFKTGNLKPGEGLTISCQMPENSVQIPGLIEEWLFNLEQSFTLIAAALAFLCGVWPLGVLLLFLFFFRAGNAESANWDSLGSSSSTFGSVGGGFGGGGGNTW
ncbi:MAG: DUF2207 domain-containing protein [Candidatus Obscuribacterales bacterium]|nr:DUF2207 domain-containing protein [Candidatus Obscuribacterales bacterium]